MHSKAEETVPCCSLEPRGGLRELNLDILHKRTWGFITKGMSWLQRFPPWQGRPQEGSTDQESEHTSSAQTHFSPRRRAERVCGSMKGNYYFHQSFSDHMKMSTHDPKTAGRINYLPNRFHMLV